MVAKWKKRTSTADVPTGPKEAKSTVLTIKQEAVIVAFSETLLRRRPLDAAEARAQLVAKAPLAQGRVPGRRRLHPTRLRDRHPGHLRERLASGEV